MWRSWLCILFASLKVVVGVWRCDDGVGFRFVVVVGLCAHGNGRAAAAASATHQQSHETYVTDRFHETILAVHLCVAVSPHTPSHTPLHS